MVAAERRPGVAPGSEKNGHRPHFTEPQVRPDNEEFNLDGIDQYIQEHPDESVGDVPLRIYLREIGEYPLLTGPQEVELAKTLERGNKAAERLLSPGLPDGERVRLEEEKRQGRRAQERLTESNLRLVVSVAKKYIGRGLPLGDLIQDGNIGLMHVVEKFDYRRGFKFSTYATWWIRQGVTRALADHGRTIRIPVHMVEAISDCLDVVSRLHGQLGRKPKAEEIGRKMGVSPDRIRYLLEIAQLPLSLETPVGDEQDWRDGQISDFVPDEDPAVQPEGEALQADMRENVQDALDFLPGRERRVLELRFGLHDEIQRTLKEVAYEFGVTRERIRQIEAKALRKLRHPSRSNKLREYVE